MKMSEKEDRSLLRDSWTVKDSIVEENQVISLDWQQLAIKKINRLNNQFLLGTQAQA